MAGRGFYVNFKVPEIERTLQQISTYDGKTRLKVEEAVQSSTKAIRNGAVRRINVHTGYLKKHTISSFDRKTVVGAIRAKAPHAHLVEFGAKAATEVPDKAKALTIDAWGNRWYAKKARIPKRAEHPFMRPAFEDEKPNLIRKLSEAVKPK